MTVNAPRPVIENAPGLVLKPIKKGWLARWQCRTDLVRRGFTPKSARLWAGAEPSETEKAFIADRCNALQSDMLVWGRGGITAPAAFDGTLKGLIDCYQTDKDSGYLKLRYHTRRSYDGRLGRLASLHGETLLREVKARQLKGWHELWSADGHTAYAHGMVGMLRTLVNFGATMLEDNECERLSGALHRMKFKMGRPREERILAEQANAVRAMAHKMGKPSIALAQAFQFECILRQKDVIGEWVPIDEPGLSMTTNGNEKWLRGLRWEEIDKNLILKHTTSKRQKDVEVNLRLAPMVMDELMTMGAIPPSGPIVINEHTRQPYTSGEFRRQWRAIARLCGIPDHVFNMDSRAGAISEALLAGAPMDSVRKAATHSDSSQTQNYSRGDAQAAAEVAKFRVESRNKKAT